jgi:dipeptidyl aminopeptidase/acylaminoacyl peptidase
MSRRAVAVFIELGLWLLVMAVLLNGCSSPSLSEPAAVKLTPTSGEKPATEHTAKAADIPLIPRDVLFGNPQKAQLRLSPDGKWISYLAPVDGVLNLWVAPADDPSQARPVSEEKHRPIRAGQWAYDNRHILYQQDKNGNENFHIFATDVETRQTKDLTPIEGVRAEIEGISEKFPHEILVGLNDRNPELHDIWRVNIDSGEKTLVQENAGVDNYLTDDDFNVRLAINFTPAGGQVWQIPEGEGEKQTWKEFQEFGPEDTQTSGPLGFDKTGRILYYKDSRGRDTAALFSMNLDTQKIDLVAEDPRCDVGGIIAHPTEKNIQAVSFTYARTEWKILDPAIQADFDYLKTVEAGDMLITSRTLDDKQWTVAFVLDDGPIKFYRYLRSPERKAIHLFDHRDDLKDYPLVKMHSPVIKSRDGLELVCYLSLPPGSDPDGDGVPTQPVPMALDVHGGPWVRDSWGLNAQHQWLANRGYAVLSVNYRGSTGFGKKFLNASNGEWSGKMHTDLLDAVKWAIDQKIAVPDKVAIMGGSYGGYATLVGLTFTPETFACGVDTVGPSSLVTLMHNVPPYWRPFMPVMKLRVGDVDTEEGRAELLKRSPLTLADKIKRPLLIGQGANDPRVKRGEADQIVAAMSEHQIPVTYVIFPDEGHGFARRENDKAFNAVTEAFLSEHLGGRFEPVGSDFEGSTITVPTGADQVPGLADALASIKHDNEQAEKTPADGSRPAK